MKNKNYILAITLIILIGIIFYLFKLQSQNSASAIKIGAALALTGDASDWGEESLKSATLAIDEINNNGGINGKKAELVVEDMKSTSKDSVLAVSKLVNVDKVKAIMITWLDSYPGSESVVPDDIPLISPDAAIESVNTPTNHSNVFSLWYRLTSKATATITAIKSSGAKNVYILLQHDPYYSKLADFLKEEADKQGINITALEFINPGDDARTNVAKINSQQPESVIFGSYDEKLSVDFLKRYDAQVKNIPLYGDEFIEQDLTDKNFSPSWLEGVEYYVPAEPQKSFIDKFKARYGRNPKFSAQTTYDTVQVLAKYLSDNPQNLVSYMKNTEFNTLTYGKIIFDEIGGVVSENPAIMMKVIKNSEPVTVQ